MPGETFAERTFTAADQIRFAAVSGDSNPVHMPGGDGVRAVAAAPVVHGIHTLLWALDSLFRATPDLGRVTQLKARFEKIITIGEPLSAALVQRGDSKARVNVDTRGDRAASIHLSFGGHISAGAGLSRLSWDDPRTSASLCMEEKQNPAGQPVGFCLGASIVQPAAPLSPALADIPGWRARVPFFTSPDRSAAMFPAAAEALGARRVAALCCATFVVGMVCPGLTSLFTGLQLAAAAPGGSEGDVLDVGVNYIDERFGRVQLGVAGGGWTGSLDTLFMPR